MGTSFLGGKKPLRGDPRRLLAFKDLKNLSTIDLQNQGYGFAGASELIMAITEFLMNLLWVCRCK